MKCFHVHPNLVCSFLYAYPILSVPICVNRWLCLLRLTSQTGDFCIFVQGITGNTIYFSLPIKEKFSHRHISTRESSSLSEFLRIRFTFRRPSSVAEMATFRNCHTGAFPEFLRIRLHSTNATSPTAVFAKTQHDQPAIRRNTGRSVPGCRHHPSAE